jgi:hypothetical protein
VFHVLAFSFFYFCVPWPHIPTDPSDHFCVPCLRIFIVLFLCSLASHSHCSILPFLCFLTSYSHSSISKFLGLANYCSFSLVIGSHITVLFLSFLCLAFWQLYLANYWSLPVFFGLALHSPFPILCFFSFLALQITYLFLCFDLTNYCSSVILCYLFSRPLCSISALFGLVFSLFCSFYATWPRVLSVLFMCSLAWWFAHFCI